jgi:hypothetical protein
MNRVRLLVAALAALTLATPPSPANAVPTSWQGVACAGGALTVETRPDHTITASGWIQPCPSTLFEPEMRFTIMYYGMASARSGELLEYTAGPAAPTAFARSLDTAGPAEPVLAVCLVHRPTTGRIACVSVDPPAGSGLPPAAPITVDDPLVTRPLPGNDPLQDNFCGTCV